jgi:hypothetical protein
MISAAGYVLRVPKNRREILLREDFSTWYSTEEPPAGEPVPRFDHSKRAPLVVFACFSDGAITHIADGRKGNGAGRDLVVLNMKSIEPLGRPIRFAELRKRAPSRLRAHLDRILSTGGKLPPKTLGAVVDIILSLQPALANRLGRFSNRRTEAVSRLTEASLANLAIQKETLTAALQIAGLRADELLAWAPETSEPRSFLDGLPQAYAREDAALISDFSTLPGFEAIREFQFSAKVFQDSSNPSIRLTVVMANRLKLEEQAGADLIYYSETYRSFVLVQYKSMERGSKGPEFRWRKNDKLSAEIARMDALLEVLGQQPADESPKSFRLHTNPFFLKLCPRILFNPDDKGLFPGMYLPLAFWRTLASDPATEGKKGGRILSYNNVGRKLSNTEFVTLVANAWVGTTVPQSQLLEKVIREVIATGKTATFAFKHHAESGRDGHPTVGIMDVEDDL